MEKLVKTISLNIKKIKLKVKAIFLTFTEFYLWEKMDYSNLSST